MNELIIVAGAGGDIERVSPGDVKVVDILARVGPGDTEPYVDAAGNAYGIGFGLRFSGAVTG